MALRIRLLRLFVTMIICLLMSVPAIAQTMYTEHELYWNLQEGQMLNCTLTWHSEFGGLPAVNETPILGNITELAAISSTFSELPTGVMTFCWPNGSLIEYQSTSSWLHHIGSILLPLGNWSLVTDLVNATYTIMEDTDTTITIYSVFIPAPELPATWKNQTISKLDGFFLDVAIGYEYPNETVTQFATIVRTGSIFTTTPTITENNSVLPLSPELLMIVSVSSILIIVVVVLVRYRNKTQYRLSV